MDRFNELRRLKMKTLFLFLLLPFFASAQQTTPSSLWVDKPVTKQDTIAILNKNITKIKVYSLYISDSTRYDKTLLGTWTLKIENGKIDSCNWNPGSFEGRLYHPITSRKYKKNKIIEVVGGNYQFTHYTDKNGNVIKTNPSFLRSAKMVRMEDGFFFDKIEYEYNSDGLLRVAKYYSEGMYDPPNIIYSKYEFEYE
jgi:hypothetical protein